MRWTRRPDGSWRPPERIRAGWVGELEQPKYKIPALRESQHIEHSAGRGLGVPQALRESQHIEQAAGRVPGLPPPEPEAPAATKVKTRRHRKKTPGEAKQAEPSSSAAPPQQPEEPAAQPSRSPDSAAKHRAGTDEDRQKAAAAKSRKEVLKAKEEDLSGSIVALRRQMEALRIDSDGQRPRERGTPPHAGGQEAPASRSSGGKAQSRRAAQERAPERGGQEGGEDEPTPSSRLQTEIIHSSSSGSGEVKKDNKAIAKKLRQIRELEERQARGEQLNEDQLAKIRTREELKLNVPSFQ